MWANLQACPWPLNRFITFALMKGLVIKCENFKR